MLKLLQALFGKKSVEKAAPIGSPATNPEYAQALEQPTKGLEFHEEIRAQVEAEKPFPVKEEKPFPVKEKKPAVKAKTVKAKTAPAKATAKKAPAKKAPAKKSK